MSGVGSAVGDLFGGAQNNAGFVAKQAPIVNPVTKEQIGSAYDQAQGALTGQSELAKLLAAQNGVQNQQDVFGQQQQLSNLLLQQANGTGPNPAQTQLNQNTAANIANQAALMAGQRGVSANPGMIARLAAQQGGAIQQNAVGQQASLQAQQQIAAQQQLGQQQQAMQQVAGQQVGNQVNAQNAYTGAALNEQQNLLGAQGSFNSALVGATGSENSANGAMAQTNANNTSKLIGGALGGIGSAFSFANGGVVDPHLAHLQSMYYGGGKVDGMVSPGEKYIPPDEVKEVVQGEKPISKAGEKIPGKAKVKGDSPKNDTVSKELEEGGIVIPRSVMESDDPVKEGKKFLVEALKKHGKPKKEENDFHKALKQAIALRGAA